MTLVATYGTLKGMSHGDFLDHAVSLTKFQLYDGGFPVAIPDDSLGLPCAGYVGLEVYAVDSTTLGYLDSYEGFPHLYDRKKYRIALSKGGVTEAWIYIGSGVRRTLSSRSLIAPITSGLLLWPFDGERPLNGLTYRVPEDS